METNLFNRLQATLLAVATVGLVFFAVLNLRQERRAQQPDDGVWWVEAQSGAGLMADKVLPDSPGERAGMRAGDILTAINDQPIHRYSDYVRELYRNGTYTKAQYSVIRDQVQLDSPTIVIPEPADRSVQRAQRPIGLVYLAIGIYVLFRRWTAPRATHFYLFCLASFALNALKYTGEWNWIDKTVFWTNIVAESVQPALFLHFALSFPEERLKNIGRRLLMPLVYAPGIAYFGLWLMAINRWEATERLRHWLDQVGTGYDAAFYVAASALFLHSYLQSNKPLQRQQLKWLWRGAFLA